MDTQRLPEGPFLRKSALAAGLARRTVDGPGFQRLFGSVRLAAQVDPSTEVLARAALLVVPGAVISHQTAALLWGGVVPEDGLVHVTVPRSGLRRVRPGLQCHLGPSPRTATLGQLVLTTPEQAFCDLAATLGLVDLVVLGDSLVHTRATTPVALHAAARAMTTGARRRAVRAADLVRERVESPMETRLRLLIVLAGLPEPRTNLTLTDEGHPRFRLDLAYPELLLAVEYDGRHHARDASQWRGDIIRREWLDGQGWRLVVVVAEDIYATPWQTVHRIAEALASRGYEKKLPPCAPAAFQEHFPGRRSASHRAV